MMVRILRLFKVGIIVLVYLVVYGVCEVVIKEVVRGFC